MSSVDRHENDEEKRVSVCHYSDAYYNEYIDRRTPLPSGTCTITEYEKFSLKKGDIVLTKDSETPDDIGIPAYVVENLNDTVCGYHLAVVRVHHTSILSEFLYRYLQSATVRDYFSVLSSGITRFGLSKGSIENVVIPTPPKKEQQLIVEKINNYSKKNTLIIGRYLQMIKVLKEYRQSLVFNVVTGKVTISKDML